MQAAPASTEGNPGNTLMHDPGTSLGTSVGFPTMAASVNGDHHQRHGCTKPTANHTDANDFADRDAVFMSRLI